jgi:hypothetical protein
MERSPCESCLSYADVELVRLGILWTRELETSDRALGLPPATARNLGLSLTSCH